ncbi:MAG: PAS domain S-box protein, partial [Nitrososphaeria archaeon]|nr:PAS domain S-box protein [Nitrososphaeria archaeon]
MRVSPLNNKIRYDLLVESLNYPIISFNHKLIIKYWNNAAIELFGWTKNEAVGKSFVNLLKAEFYDIDYDGFIWRISTTKKVCAKALMYRKNGVPVYVELDVSRIKGKRKEFVALVRDVTLQKKIDDLLKESSLKIEELFREKERKVKESETLAAIGRATSMIGHDLRNPLQTIANLIYLAKNRTTDSKIIDILDAISEQMAYMHKIILDLQDFSTPKVPVFQTYSIEELFSLVLKSIKVPDNVKVVKNLRIKTIKTNWVSFIRIMQNLISNAVQAMPNGGILTVEAFSEENNIVLRISDTGSGIPREHFSKIFQPY